MGTLLAGAADAATRTVGPLSGSCTGTYQTIQAAANAAGGGDTILVCPGTYNEAVSIPRTLTLRGSTGNAADVTVTHSGMTISQSASGTLTLKDMTVTSTGATAVYLQWNADGGHVFENLVVSGRNYGIYAERGATNLKNITAAGTDYSAIYLGNKHAATFDTVTATGASHGIHVAHSDTTNNAYSFTRVTASSRERAIRVTRSGKVTMTNVSATSSAHTAIHLEWDADGGHAFENITATGDNYGIYADRGAASLKNVTVTSQRQTAIYLGNKYAATFDTVTATSANYGGLWIGNSDSVSHGYGFTNVKVTAKGTGISIDRSGKVTMKDVAATSTATGDAGRAAISLEWNADGGHKLENVTAANNARWYGAIYLARGAVTLKNIIAKNTFTGTNGTQNEAIRMGSKYGDSFDTLTAESGGGGGIAILNSDAASNALGFKDVTVTSKYTGIDIQRSGTVTMNGIKVSSSDGAGIYLGWNADAGNRHRFSNLDITAAATGLQTVQGLGWVEDFKIKITSNNGAGIIFTTKYDASVQRGTIDVGNNYGIFVLDGGDKSVTVADVTIQSGGTVEGIRLNRSSSALIQRVCTSGSSNVGIRAQWDARNVTIKDSQFANGGAYGGVMIYSNSSYKATVANNAFLKTAPRRAYSDSTVHTFNGNYWQGVAGGTVYTDGDVRDNGTLSAAPAISCYANVATLSTHYKFDDTWGSSDTLDDSSGGNKPATLSGTVVQERASASGAKPDTCKAGNFNRQGYFTTVSGLDIDTAADKKNSVSFWMYWDGGFHSSNFTMPFSWGGTYYDLAVSKYRSEMGNGVIGFNTGNGDVFGVTADGLANGWHHVAAVFNNGDVTKSKLYIDGVAKSLTSYGSQNQRSVTTSAGIGAGAGWGGDYKWSGKLDNLKIYKGEISAAQIIADMADSSSCLPTIVGEWRMDESSWNGTAGEIRDGSGNDMNGTAMSGTDLATTAPEKLCRGGVFDNRSFAEIPDSANLRLATSYTMGAWIKTLKSSGTIISKTGTSSPWSGYVFALGPDSGGKLALWNGTGSWYSSTGAAVNDGTWHHVAVAVNGTSLQFYVDGSLNGSAITLAGITTVSTSPLRVGYENNPGAASRYFSGRIDEPKLWSGALTAAEIAAGYANEAAGKNWDGTTRTCALTGKPSRFNCIEAGVAADTGRLYTKIAGTAFAFDVAALKIDGTVETGYASDASKNVTVELGYAADSDCTGWVAANPAVSQTLTFAAANAGRKAAASMTVTKAYPSLRCRVTDANQAPSIVGCSTDNFSVRPAAFAVSSSANADASGANVAAVPIIKTGVNFTLTATATTGYNGTPLLDPAKVVAHPGAVRPGTLAGVFGAADIGTGMASGSSFTYNEAGYFKLAANGVYDNTFTAVDGAVDCTNDFSNALVGGKYGCKFGNPSDTSYFGRFIPDHFTLVPSATVPGCGIFTYFGQDGFATPFTLTAQNSAAGTTQNYTGSFAKLGLANWNSFGFVATGLPAGSTLSASATPPWKTDSNPLEPASWSNGVASVTAKHQISRPTDLTGETKVTVSAKPTDADGVTTPTSVIVATDTPLRFGRLRLFNAYGSVSPLYMQVELQYWSGKSWVKNTDDSCTTTTGSTPQVTFSSADDVKVTPGIIKDGAMQSGGLKLERSTTGSADVDAVVPDWLKSPDGDNPKAKATFGVYGTKESHRTIHARELY